jgi:hypothetical protein
LGIPDDALSSVQDSKELVVPCDPFFLVHPASTTMRLPGGVSNTRSMNLGFTVTSPKPEHLVCIDCNCKVTVKVNQKYEWVCGPLYATYS